MTAARAPWRRAWDAVQLAFWRVAASGWVPARWFNAGLPPPEARQARTGVLDIEIVSHCWRYAHLLAFQLNSLVRHPPRRTRVTMTVFHAPDDDATVELLAHFGAITVPHVRWNWQPRPKERLFRRAIGRHEAAVATRADWVWFTDCDVVFGPGCLDALADALQGRRDALVYPRVEACSELLADDDPRLHPADPAAADIGAMHFVPLAVTRATGPLQITHGDVARALGYCGPIGFYHRPAERWQKAHEDRAHRWLLQTQGVPIDVPQVHRIRHASKGRYADGGLMARLRRWWRQRLTAARDARERAR